MSDQLRDTNFLDLLTQQEKTARYLQLIKEVKTQSNEGKSMTTCFLSCMHITAKEKLKLLFNLK